MATNYERITGTPEDLAETLLAIGDCDGFKRLGICPEGGCLEMRPLCIGAAVDWLQEECDE